MSASHLFPVNAAERSAAEDRAHHLLRQRAPCTQLFVFDLDGTLIDSLPQIAAAVQALRAKCKLARLSLDRVRSSIGEGARQMLVKCCADAISPTRDLTALYELYLEEYRRASAQPPQVFSGVREFLTAHAKRWQFAVLTNKPLEITRLALAAAELAGYFARVVCPENAAATKPHAAGLEALIAELGATRETTVFVGDSVTDFVTGAAAQVFTVGLRSGYYVPAAAGSPTAAQPDVWLEDFASLHTALHIALPSGQSGGSDTIGIKEHDDGNS
ncbi:MAG: HAD family hydrolase [Planctomycetota bacterium]